MTRPPRLFIIAGEPSGDVLGAGLMAGLAELTDGQAVFQGLGGPSMQEAGLTSLFSIDELSIMGLVEILPNVPRLIRRLNQTADAVVAMQPDALITIDSPDFCLRVAHRVRRRLPHLRTIHYVAPSVWAWRPGRAGKMAKVIDHVLTLLPFEPPYMQAAGMTAEAVGHPVVTQPVTGPADHAALRQLLGIEPDVPVLTVLPGSRRGEVARLGDVFCAVVEQLKADRPKLEVVIPAAAPVVDQVQAAFGPGIHVLDPRGQSRAVAERHKLAAFGTSTAALAASGTVSLELAAQNTPMVIAYTANALTRFMVKRLALIDTANLINIVTDTRVVPEFLLERCTPELIAPAVANLLDDAAARQRQHDQFDPAMRALGRGAEAPHLRAARSILSVLPTG